MASGEIKTFEENRYSLLTNGKKIIYPYSPPTSPGSDAVGYGDLILSVLQPYSYFGFNFFNPSESNMKKPVIFDGKRYYYNYGDAAYFEAISIASQSRSRKSTRFQYKDKNENPVINTDSLPSGYKNSADKYNSSFFSKSKNLLYLDVVPVSDTEVTILSNYQYLDKIDQTNSGKSKLKEDSWIGGDGIDYTIDSSATFGPVDSFFKKYSEVVAVTGGSPDDVKYYADPNGSWTKLLRFGSSTGNKMIRNPFYDKDCPKLKCEKKDALIFVSKIINRETSSYDRFLSKRSLKNRYYPISLLPASIKGNGKKKFDSFFSLSGVDWNKYVNDTDYLVIKLGDFEFSSGVVSNMVGPFCYDFSTANNNNFYINGLNDPPNDDSNKDIDDDPDPDNDEIIDNNKDDGLIFEESDPLGSGPDDEYYLDEDPDFSQYFSDESIWFPNE